MILVVLYSVIVPISWCEQKLLTGWMEKLRKDTAKKLICIFSLQSQKKCDRQVKSLVRENSRHTDATDIHFYWV